MKLIKTFLSDEDGLSAKDYLLLLFTTVYVVFLLTAFGKALIGHPLGELKDLISGMDTIIMTIVGGEFGVMAVRTWTNGVNNNQSQQQYTFMPTNPFPPTYPMPYTSTYNGYNSYSPYMYGTTQPVNTQITNPSSLGSGTVGTQPVPQPQPGKPLI